MIVDCHMHAWRYPDHANKAAILAHMPKRRRSWPEERFIQIWDNPIEGYFAEIEGTEVGRAIIQGLKAPDTMGLDVPNEYIAGVVRQHPDKLAWCCGVNPTEKGAAAEVERCVKKWGAVGVGELGPSYGGYYINDERCWPVWDKAQELGVPIVVHAGPAQVTTSHAIYGNPILVDEVAIKFPDLKIVICHLGYHKYEDALFLLQKHENIYSDISWLDTISGLDRVNIPRYLPAVEYPYFHLLHPLLYALSQTFGDADKLVWGSDWRGASPRRSLEVFNNINQVLAKYNLPPVPQETMHKILHENWKKVFPLKGI